MAGVDAGVDGRVGLEAGDGRPDARRIDLDERRADPAQRTRSPDAEPEQQAGPLPRLDAGLPSDDQLSRNGVGGWSEALRVRTRGPGADGTENGENGKGGCGAAAGHQSHRGFGRARERPPFGEAQAPEAGAGWAGLSS